MQKHWDPELQIEYYTHGSGEKELLLLHGGFVMASGYAWVIKNLGKKYKIIAPNLPGHGRTPAHTNFESTGKTLGLFADKYTTAPIVLAHSFGGLCAVYMMKYTDKVKRLILTNALGLGGDATLFRVFKDLFVIDTLVTIYHDITLVRFYIEIVATMLINTITRPLNYAKGISLIFKARNENPDKSHITVPTNILWGKYDILLPSEVGMSLAQQIEGAQFKSIKGGHNWMGNLTVEELESYL